MRKLAVIGTLAAGVLLGTTGADAAQVDSQVGGSMVNNTNTCYNIVDLFIDADCSYANTRYPPSSFSSWVGPQASSAFYERGGTQETDNNYVITPGDGKYSMPLTGIVTVDDNGTPANGSDDLISGVLTFGTAVHYVVPGAGRSVIEVWDELIHTMPATAVSSATANGAGGYDYVIGSRGRPTPVPGPLLGLAGTQNEGLTFPSEYASDAPNVPENIFWSTNGSTDLPVGSRIGIERSVGYGNVNNTGGANLQPNVGAQTTAVFTNYTCKEKTGGTDCVNSEAAFGSGNSKLLNEDGTSVAGDGNPATVGNCNDGIDNDGTGGTDSADPECAPRTSPPGFENIILTLSTGADGRVTTAEAYWTREWVLKNGSQIGDDLNAGPTRYTTPNSWDGGRFAFKGCSFAGPVTVNDAVTVGEGTTTNLQVLTNDTPSCAEPNTINIVGGGTTAEGGSVVVSGSAISYTAPPDFFNTTDDGTDSFQYTITDDDSEVSGTATVTITVTKKVPTSSNTSGSSSAGAAVARTVITSANQGSGTIAQHTITPGPATLGSCVDSGNGVLTFTPTPQGGNGTGGCSFTITDADGDVSGSSNFSVDVQNNSGGGGGSSGPQLPGGGSSLDALTLGGLLAGIPLLARRRRRKLQKLL